MIVPVPTNRGLLLLAIGHEHDPAEAATSIPQTGAVAKKTQVRNAPDPTEITERIQGLLARPIQCRPEVSDCEGSALSQVPDSPGYRGAPPFFAKRRPHPALLAMVSRMSPAGPRQSE